MKNFALFLAFFSLLFSCSGDCLACHPKLKPTINRDQRHKPMLDCIDCHNKDLSSTGECGSDCFDCHKPKKIMKGNVAAHNVIASCIQCHAGIQNESLLAPPPNFSSSSLFE